MKNKINRIILLFLILASSVSNTVFAADLLDANDQAETQGISDGSYFGDLDGRECGFEDYNNGELNDYTDRLMTENEIAKKYKLTDNDYYYKYYFIQAYQVYFQIAYKSAFRESKSNDEILDYGYAFDHGVSLGEKQGEISAFIDFSNELTNDWERAYTAFINNGTLLSRFRLDRESTDYQTYFSSGFREGFKNSYAISFQEENVLVETQNISFQKIGLSPMLIEYSDSAPSYTSGYLSIDTDYRVNIDFPEGAVYEDVYFGLGKLQKEYRLKNEDLRAISAQYKIQIGFTPGTVTLEKPIKLSFEYYGTSKAGIYEYTNGKWVYLPSNFEEGTIYTEIPSGYYDGGVYALFIDEDYVSPLDITFNWARSEIDTLARRGILDQAVYFNPNQSITREEFAELIYRAFNQLYPKTTTSSRLVLQDQELINENAILAVDYMISKGYMALDSNNNFNPNALMTYTELQHTMSVILSYSFEWETIADKMLYDNYKKSLSYSSYENHPLRSEVAFLIYELIK